MTVTQKNRPKHKEGGTHNGKTGNQTEKYIYDVLIIGGGIAGLTAAISVKEENPEISVLVVEKQTSGYSGKANKGGGVLQYFRPEKNHAEMFNEYHANAVGGYTGQPEFTEKICGYE